MEIVYTLPLPESNSELFIAAFAKQHGWTPDLNVTAIEHSRMTINNFIKESVADRLATMAAEQAKQQTVNALTVQFDSIASTLTINN